MANRAREDLAKVLRQRHAEIHGAAPAPPAWAGGPQMTMSAEQSAHHAATLRRSRGRWR